MSHTLAADVARHDAVAREEPHDLVGLIVNTSSIVEKEAAAAACGRGCSTSGRFRRFPVLLVSG